MIGFLSRLRAAWALAGMGVRPVLVDFWPDRDVLVVRYPTMSLTAQASIYLRDQVRRALGRPDVRVLILDQNVEITVLQGKRGA